MPSFANQRMRLALIALAALAGLLVAPAGASASCEGMAATGTCPPSKVACCCSKAEVEVDLPAVDSEQILPAASTCSCEQRPQVPATPTPKPARIADDRLADRGGEIALELPGLRLSPCPAGSTPCSWAGPPHVPLYLRNARFLI
jgi:hypothetical protein